MGGILGAYGRILGENRIIEKKRQYRDGIVGKWRKNIAIDRRKEYTISVEKIGYKIVLNEDMVCKY